MATTTALFVIDIQNDLATDPKTRVPHAERIRAAGDKILATARGILQGKTENPPTVIVFVQHEEKPESGPLLRGSEPWKLVFEPRGDGPEILVSKTTRK
jgi:nicotinamidase-related amidase